MENYKPESAENRRFQVVHSAELVIDGGLWGLMGVMWFRTLEKYKDK